MASVSSDLRPLIRWLISVLQTGPRTILRRDVNHSQLSIIKNMFPSGRLSRSNKPLLEQCPNLSIFLPVDSIVASRIYLLVFNYQPSINEFGQRHFDGCRMMFDLLLDQPPFDDSFERVLSILMLNQVSQDMVFELRLFYSAHILRSRAHQMRSVPAIAVPSLLNADFEVLCARALFFFVRSILRQSEGEARYSIRKSRGTNLSQRR